MIFNIEPPEKKEDEPAETFENPYKDLIELSERISKSFCVFKPDNVTYRIQDIAKKEVVK